jgi:hypothetical protein
MFSAYNPQEYEKFGIVAVPPLGGWKVLSRTRWDQSRKVFSDNKNQGFTRLSITNGTIDWLNIYIFGQSMPSSGVLISRNVGGLCILDFYSDKVSPRAYWNIKRKKRRVFVVVWMKGEAAHAVHFSDVIPWRNTRSGFLWWGEFGSTYLTVSDESLVY